MSQVVSVPLEAVIAIYARETGQGMALPEELSAAPSAPPPPIASGPVAVESPQADAQQVEDGIDDHGSSENGPSEGGPDRPTQPPKRGNHLRIVK